MEKLDIYSKGAYPSDVLSNFYPNAFAIDGVECGGMEGFLQSLKFRNEKKQRKVCALSGKEAKKKGGMKFLWKLTGKVYWQGKKYSRVSDEFSGLISRAYDEMFSRNEKFRKALADSIGYELCHSIGKSDERKTILTEREFIFQLNRLREKTAKE